MNVVKKQSVGFLALLALVFCLVIPQVFADNITATLNVTNEPPIASSALINGGSNIILTANQTTLIEGQVTVTDNNGCEDIRETTATLYRSDIGYNGLNDDQNHYSVTCVNNSDCTEGGGDFTETFTCYFNMTWYADPTDVGSHYDADIWEFNATPSDIVGTGTSDTDTEEVRTLTAISIVTTAIDFGELALGEDTGAMNVEAEIQNHGNEQLDVALRGYGSSDVDGFAMVCTLGAIDVEYLEYSDTSFSYGGGNAMDSLNAELELNIEQGSNVDPRPVKTIYFGLGLPANGLRGTCLGTIVVTAVSDPVLD